jgi:TRAP-type C4-dicarboxylate transport system permease small subunit
MERGFMMLIHSIILALILFIFMRFVLGQSMAVAEDRSMVALGLILIYMVLFGHGMPTSINKNLF